MKALWISAALALASCGPQAASPPASAPPPATDPALAAISAMERPAASTAAERAGSQCTNGEAVVFSCTISGKTASICVGPTTIDYRYGALGAPELRISSTGIDGRAHVLDITGAGGGAQTAVRFSNDGYEYIVHAMEAGALTDVPGQKTAGVTVLRGEAPVSELHCPDPERHQFSAASIPAQGETDERYEAWW